MTAVRGAPPAVALGVAALGIALYSVMDGFMKALALDIGAYSALFWRLSAGLVLTAALYASRRPRRPSARVLRVHAARSVVVATMAVAFFWGIARVPLAEAVALSFIAPVIALVLASVFLKERIGAGALWASVLGLAGVGVILAGRLGGTHGSDTGRGFAAILFSAVAYAVNLVMARHQAQLAGPFEIAFWQNLFVFAILCVGSPFLIVAPSTTHWPLIAGAAVLAVVSLLLLSWANARAEAQRLVSVEYTAFIWAALTGWVAFREPLTLVTVAGTMLIVAGCWIAARDRGAPALPEAEAAA